MIPSPLHKFSLNSESFSSAWSIRIEINQIEINHIEGVGFIRRGSCLGPKSLTTYIREKHPSHSVVLVTLDSMLPPFSLGDPTFMVDNDDAATTKIPMGSVCIFTSMHVERMRNAGMNVAGLVRDIKQGKIKRPMVTETRLEESVTSFGIILLVNSVWRYRGMSRNVSPSSAQAASESSEDWREWTTIVENNPASP